MQAFDHAQAQAALSIEYFGHPATRPLGPMNGTRSPGLECRQPACNAAAPLPYRFSAHPVDPTIQLVALWSAAESGLEQDKNRLTRGSRLVVDGPSGGGKLLFIAAHEPVHDDV